MSTHRPEDGDVQLIGEDQNGDQTLVGVTKENGSARLNTESRNTDTFTILNDILVELRIMNQYNEIASNISIDKQNLG